MEKNLTILDAIGKSVRFPDLKCTSFPNILRSTAGYISQAAKCASSLSPPCAHLTAARASWPLRIESDQGLTSPRENFNTSSNNYEVNITILSI